MEVVVVQSNFQVLLVPNYRITVIYVKLFLGPVSAAIC